MGNRKALNYFENKEHLFWQAFIRSSGYQQKSSCYQLSNTNDFDIYEYITYLCWLEVKEKVY